jgi:hypothetical protein
MPVKIIPEARKLGVTDSCSLMAKGWSTSPCLLERQEGYHSAAFLAVGLMDVPSWSGVRFISSFVESTSRALSTIGERPAGH